MEHSNPVSRAEPGGLDFASPPSGYFAEFVIFGDSLIRKF
jgi:hypothetical protein